MIPDSRGYGVAGSIGGMSDTPTPGLGDELRQLRRSRDDRVVAGVLGGVARRLNVDPVLLRIVTVVLALFGGVGVVLYALGWLLIPAEDADASVAEEALGRGRTHSPELPTIALAVGLVVAIIIAAGGTFRSGVGSLLLVLAIVGGVMLLRRRDEAGETQAAATDGIQQTYPDYPGYPGYPHASDEPTDGPAATAAGTQPAPGQESVSVSAVPAAVPPGDIAASTGTGWPEGPDWGPAAPEPYYEPVPTEPPARPRSFLGLLTVSATALAIGVLAVMDATWATIPVSAYIATALAVVGLGLLIGTWFGRSRGLIWLGLALAIALPPAVLVADDLDLTADHTRVVLTSIAEVPQEPQTHGTGQVTYDLSGMELADDDAIELVINQSIGQLRVIVPPEADVQLTAGANLGEVVAFDGMSGGFQPSRSVVDLGPDGEGGGIIELELELGIGQIEVSR